MKKYIISICCFLIVSCGSSSSSTTTSTSSNSVKYKITFTTQWNSDNFATNFPSGRHFSGLIGATHNENASVWAVNDLSSLGIESMAETGSKSLLKSEMDLLKVAGNIEQIIDKGGISSSQESITIEISMNSDFPLLTLVSMVAPSPDWFVGIHDLLLFSNGEWTTSKTIDLLVYDAGTDDGLTFSSANAETSTHTNIISLTSNSTDTDFINGIHSNSSLHIGQFTITKIE